MFDFGNNQNSKDTKKKSQYGNFDDQNIVPFALMVIAGVGAIWVHQNIHKIEHFYFVNFEKIWMGVYIALMALVIYPLIWKFHKSCRGFRSRASLLAPRWTNQMDNVFAGTTLCKEEVDLFVSDKDRCGHVQIIGSTGRGKTKSVVVPWVVQDIKREHSSFIIDGKGGKELFNTVCGHLRNTNLDQEKHCFLFDLENIETTSLAINPLANGTSQQIVDRIFASFEFDETYYRAVQYEACSLIVEAICFKDESVTFRRLYELLKNDDVLATLAKSIEFPELKQRLRSFLGRSKKDRDQELAGLVAQIAPFAVGEIAPVVNGESDELKEFRFKDFLVDEQTICFFVASLSTLKYQKLGSQLGKLMMQDIAWCVGRREELGRQRRFASIFLDEFAEFVYPGFVSLLNKARSSNIGLHLSHQAMSDLSVVSPDFARSVNTNTNVKCILGLNDPETADFFARHIGTKTDQKITEQVREEGFFRKSKVESGRGSLREVESYKVHPNTLKEFYNGRGVLHFPTENGLISEVVSFRRSA